MSEETEKPTCDFDSECPHFGGLVAENERLRKILAGFGWTERELKDVHDAEKCL